MQRSASTGCTVPSFTSNKHVRHVPLRLILSLSDGTVLIDSGSEDRIDTLGRLPFEERLGTSAIHLSS